MIKRFLFSLLILASLSNFSDASINDVSNAICRISNSEAYCTGWCFKEDADYYYLISAGHFKGGLDDKIINVTLYHSGETKIVGADIVFWVFNEGTANDLSVFKVKKDSLGDYKAFEPIKLAKSSEGTKLLWSYGCPDGKWPTAFKGRFLELNKTTANCFNISPPIIPGRSGSPVLNEDGEAIGMVIMTMAKVTNVGEVPVYGIASSVENLHTILKENNIGE